MRCYKLCRRGVTSNIEFFLMNLELRMLFRSEQMISWGRFMHDTWSMPSITLASLVTTNDHSLVHKSYVRQGVVSIMISVRSSSYSFFPMTASGDVESYVGDTTVQRRWRLQGAANDRRCRCASRQRHFLLRGATGFLLDRGASTDAATAVGTKCASSSVGLGGRRSK